MGRTLLGVIGGFVIAFVVTVVFVVIAGIIAPSFMMDGGLLKNTPGPMTVTVLAFGLAATAGCYFAALMNMGRPMRHAVATALTIAAANLLFVLVSFHYGEPIWIHLLRAAIALPSGVIAGKIFLSRHPYDAPS